MYIFIVASFFFPCVAGAMASAILAMMIKVYVTYERAQTLKEEENTDEAAAAVIGKEHYTTTTHSEHSGSSTTHHYKVSYEFSAETADGTPCKVQVLGREIDGTKWDKLVEGRKVQVLYLQGRPGSCRMKDIVEIEGDGAGMRCQIKCLACFLLILASMSGFATFMTSGVAMSQDPGESQQILIGGVAVFFVAFCGCSVLCGGAAYHTRMDDNIYGGQVNVEDLPESECDNDYDNFTNSA